MKRQEHATIFMEPPTNWAKSAINKKGASFVLKLGEQLANAVLIDANQHSMGEGFECFHFIFEAPDTDESPSADGMYSVSGGDIGETELFLVFNPGSDESDLWSATVTGKA